MANTAHGVHVTNLTIESNEFQCLWGANFDEMTHTHPLAADRSRRPARKQTEIYVISFFSV